MLTQEIKQAIEQSVLCWLATATGDGQPSVSPKEIFLTAGETHVLIANIASPNSVRNIKANPQVCVSFLDVLVQKGVQIFGQARIIEATDTDFETRAKGLKALAGTKFPVQSVIEIEVTRVKPIFAPRYRFYTDTTEEAQVARALKSYGMRLGQSLEKADPNNP